MIKVAFASGTDDLNRRLVARMREVRPDLPLYVVSEFPPGDEDLRWVPYHVKRGFVENWARCRAALAGRRIRLAGVMLVPNVPYRRMRLMALLMAPRAFLGVNENLNDFMLRPRSLHNLGRHICWRVKNFLTWQVKPGGWLHEQVRRMAHPEELRAHLCYWSARALGAVRVSAQQAAREPEPCVQPGVSVVIPLRNGYDLLTARLPKIMRELEGLAAEIIVPDNGSGDGTSDRLAREYPGVLCETSASPRSYARAANAGIRRARYSRVLLLGDDILPEAGFLAPLQRAFNDVPGLFCATAQVRYSGVGRGETGKAVFSQQEPDDFPVREVAAVPGEDLSYVLSGSHDCSLYDAAKLLSLGGFNETYGRALVKDLDLGYRAWQRGWPTVFATGVTVEQDATSPSYGARSRFDAVLEAAYLRFLSGTVADRRVFRRLWRQALWRLLLKARRGEASAAAGLRLAPNAALQRGGSTLTREDSILALTSGAVAVFPGRAAAGKPRVLVASPYLPFPLAHGGAVRIYNLMRHACADFDQILVSFCDRLEAPAPELLEICTEVVLVRRRGSHSPPSTERPEVVEQFASPAFAAALRQTVQKWQPDVAQLEFTQMAQYAGDCAPCRTLLVEHDVTFDLYQQLLSLRDDWELRHQLARWRRFETAAWRKFDRVIVMSEKDRALVSSARAEVLPNGVDLERFRPSGAEPEPRRLLFIGSFAHLPNLLAIEFFLREVWPRLRDVKLHVIAGARHDYFLRYFQDRVRPDLARPGIEVEGFVSDVRPAYCRAALVVAPLVASAGTNIKIMEAMAMGKAVVSTPAGVNGLDLAPGTEFALANYSGEMAREIERLCQDAPARMRMETAARDRVERDYGWDVIAKRQASVYRGLLPSAMPARSAKREKSGLAGRCVLFPLSSLGWLAGFGAEFIR